MPSLILTADDAGKVVPISGQGNWQVSATDAADNFEISSGTNATITGGGGVDVIRFIGVSSADYEISLSGSKAVFKHKSSDSSVYIPMGTLGDTISFGNESSQLLKIESGMFKFGSQVLSSTPATIVGASSQVNYVLDGKGSASGAVSETLATGALNLTDAVSVANNISLTGFGTDDKITITGATSAQYDNAISSNSAGDVTFAYNSAGTLNTIVLVGVAGTSTVYDVASFNALSVGDIIFA